MPHSSNTSVVALVSAVIVASVFTSTVQRSPASESESELKRNFAAEHEIGRRYHIDPADLPAPKTGPIVTDRPLLVPYSGQTLQVPQGFVATPFATGLANPRRLLVLANGDVLVAEQSAGYVTLLRDDGEGHAKWIDRHVEDLNKPYGLAWQGDHLLVADQDGIWRVPHVVGAMRPGRAVPPQRADELAPEQRRPVPGAYGAEMITKKASSASFRDIRTAIWRSIRRAAPYSLASVQRAISAWSLSRRRRSSGSMRTDRTKRHTPLAPAIRPHSPSTQRPANCGRWCRSAMGWATICLLIT